MSSEDDEKKKEKAARRKNPIQFMKKGDDNFYAVNSQIVEEPILTCLKWGKPCDPKDESITLNNICWFHKPKFGTRRLLRNSENKLRIPTDAELIKIYGNTKKKEGETVTIKKIELKIFDPRWAKLKDKASKKKKKPTTKRKVKESGDDESARIAKLESELKKLKKKKKE